MADKEIKFTDIPYVEPIPISSGVLDEVRTLNVGQGNSDNVFRVDRQGIWLGGKTFGLAPFSVTMNGIVGAISVTAGSFQTAISGQRIVISSSDNYIKAYDANENLFATFGGSTDGTERYIDLITPTTVDRQMMRLFAQKTTGTELSLHTVSKGYQSIRLQNDNTNAYRNTNNVPILDIFQLGTGLGIKISTSSSYDSLPLHLTLGFTTSANPVLKLTQNAITSTNFRKIFQEENTSTSIWFSNGTTPNGNLTGQAGDICLNGDSGNIYRCTGTTNWTAM